MHRPITSASSTTSSIRGPGFYELQGRAALIYLLRTTAEREGSLSVAGSIRAWRSDQTRKPPLFRGVGMHPSGPRWPHSCAPFSSPGVTISGRNSPLPRNSSRSQGRRLSYLVRAVSRNGGPRPAPGPDPAPPHGPRVNSVCLSAWTGAPGLPLHGVRSPQSPLSSLVQRVVVPSAFAGASGVQPLSLRLRRRHMNVGGPSPFF